MKILSFTPPSSCFKPVCFFLLLSTKEDILKNVGSQTVDGNSIVFFPHNMEVSGHPQQRHSEERG